MQPTVPTVKGVLVVIAITTALVFVDKIPFAAASPPASSAATAARTAGGEAAPKVTGDASTGKSLFSAKGCVACHVAQGVPGAVGMIGPSLNGIGDPAKRATLASGGANTPANLSRWIKDPQSMKPGTQMPNLGLTQKESDDLTAFLTTLK